MIYSKEGETFWYNDTPYAVGAKVFANADSDYFGLLGRILEIRTENDCEAQSNTPNIYCDFDPPALTTERVVLQQQFSLLHYESKPLEALNLHRANMEPQMLVPLPVPVRDYPQLTLYIVASHWSNDGEYGSYEIPYTDLFDAKRQLHDDLLEERKNGCIERWRSKSQFVEEETDDSYECYLDGEYCENHFSIEVKKQLLPLASEFLETVGNMQYEKTLRMDFGDAVKTQEEFRSLTHLQQEKLLATPELPEEILSQLMSSASYNESYQEAISQIASSLLAEFRKQFDSGSQK